IVFLLFTYLTLRCCSICPRNWLFADVPSLAQQSMIFRVSCITGRQSAFDSVKLRLTSSPVLSAPDMTKPIKLEVDASGVGAVLIQEDDH
ncbi:hypothetical protein QTP70_029456, partial [Hemibagrus guttatus]